MRAAIGSGVTTRPACGSDAAARAARPAPGTKPEIANPPAAATISRRAILAAMPSVPMQFRPSRLSGGDPSRQGAATLDAPRRTGSPCRLNVAEAGHGAGTGGARRPLRARARPGAHDRHPGAGATADAAAPARSGGRAQYRRIHLGLPRLAPGWARSGPVARPEVPGAKRHRLPARDQRGSGRHRRLGLAAGRPVPGREIRWRLCSLVRQGPRRRPLARRAQARQSCGHLQAWRRAGRGRRRPRRQILDPAAPVRPRLRRRRDPGPQSLGRAGLSRPRHPWLGDVALLRLLGGAQGSDRHGREHRHRRRRPAPGRGGAAAGLRHAARRALDPLAGPAAGPGSADAGAQGLRRPGLRPRQPSQPDRHRQPQAAPGHHDRRQVLSRRTPGIGRSRHRRAARGGDRPARDEGRHDLAARAGRHAPLRRGAGGDPGRRGEAAAPRVPAQGGALQLERGGPAAHHRQVRREGRVVPAPGRLAAAVSLRADAGDDRARDRRAHRPLPYQREDPAAPRLHHRQGSRPRPPAPVDPARAALLLGLPAQHQHPRTRRQPGAGRHRLPLHGDLDLRGDDADLQPDGRRGRGLDRPGAVHRDAARVRQSRRRHLLPLRHPGDPRCGRRQGQHHLQDPLQRRRRHDRRPAARGLAQRGAARWPARGRGAGADRGRGRRRRGRQHRCPAGRCAGAAARGARCGAAGPARDQGHHGPDLCPDLRRREAPPPQARRLPRSRQARRDQRHGLRGLRRLQQQVELRLGRAGRDRVGPQARDRPVELQQGLLLRQRLLPELRHRRGRPAAQGHGGRRRAPTCRHCPRPPCRAWQSPGAS